MMRPLPAVLALLLPVAALAQGNDLGNPVMGGPLGRNDPTDHAVFPRAYPLPAPSPPLEEDQLRRQLLGKPVYGAGGGRLGVVSDLVIGADRRITNVVVQIDAELDPDRANLALPWAWVSAQLDAPTLVVPWNSAMVAWLTEPGRSRRTVVDVVAPPAQAQREAWQQQAAAELDQWRDRIDTLALGLDERDTGLRQLRVAYGAARDRWERLTQAGEDSWTLEQGKLQADLDTLRQRWGEAQP